MCGIAGIVNADDAMPVRAETLKGMCDVLAHRGPDDEGFFIEGNVGIGMRRLSIIDLHTGHQPIANEDGRIRIVFNGEIYNFNELRRELEQKGHEFSTNSDTEAIVHAYEEYGDDCVHHLNGMFSFAIWDGRTRKLLLARDRLGIKPLYYYQNARAFVFGSEIKSILESGQVSKEVDPQALDLYLAFEYVPSPHSMFKGIKKLPPGHLLVLRDGQASISQYWELARQQPDSPQSAAELCDRLYDLLKDSVRMRLISDMPLGAFLSGGIDSSAIVCMMSEMMDRPVKTFSIGFDDPSYNELGYAREVAQHFGTDHHELVIKPEVVDLVQGLATYLDEPLADVSVFPTYLVSKLAREHVTVVLSGDGGDELFAGYDWYLASKMDSYYRRLPGVLRNRLIPALVGKIPPSSQKKGVVNKVKRFVDGAMLPESLMHFRWNIYATAEMKDDLLSPEFKKSLNGANTYDKFVSYLETAAGSDPLWQQQFADIKTFMVDDILVKVDRMSMANSLEARVPFLDHRLVEFAAGVPSDLKLRGMTTKYLLKKAMESKLPSSVINRRKEGFSIPMKNWLKEELRPMMGDYLSESRLKDGGFFNPRYVQRLMREHLEGSANHAHQLWSLMMFEIWKEKYI